MKSFLVKVFIPALAISAVFLIPLLLFTLGSLHVLFSSPALFFREVLDTIKNPIDYLFYICFVSGTVITTLTYYLALKKNKLSKIIVYIHLLPILFVIWSGGKEIIGYFSSGYSGGGMELLILIPAVLIGFGMTVTYFTVVFVWTKSLYNRA